MLQILIIAFVNGFVHKVLYKCKPLLLQYCMDWGDAIESRQASATLVLCEYAVIGQVLLK